MDAAGVEALVAAGRVLDAVDELTRLAERSPDPAHDRRLVELRHLAFDVLDRSPGRATWPPSYDDPFPDDDGLVCIDAAELDHEVVGGAVTRHGCLRVDGLVDAPGVARLRAAIDEAFESRERHRAAVAAGDPPPDEAGAAFSPFAVGAERAAGFGGDVFVRTCDAPGALREVASVLDRTGVADVVTAYFGERPAMIANKWILRRSPSGVATSDFHQDGAFLGGGIRALDVWIALSDCGPGTGRPGIDLVPRRFPLLEPGEASLFRWSLDEATVARAMPGAAVERPVLRAGDALVFDELLPHRTTPGEGLGERHAIESWFVAPSSYPDRHVPLVL